MIPMTDEKGVQSYQVTLMQVIQWEYTFFRRYRSHSPISTKCTTCENSQSYSKHRISIVLQLRHGVKNQQHMNRIQGS